MEKRLKKFSKQVNNSWNNVSKWYTKVTENGGHYYHSHVVLPQVLKLTKFDTSSRVLDVGCGTGVLGEVLPKDVSYLGIDLSTNLINEAKKRDRNRLHEYKLLDAGKIDSLQGLFSHIFFILSFQNMENGQKIINLASQKLGKNGQLILVLNHPAFRIPRQSSWQIDQNRKIEYRRIDRYLSDLKIPVNMNPHLKSQAQFTWSYHYSISTIFKFLSDNNLHVVSLEEWNSDKISTGKNARQENRARNEFPLFLAIKAVKH